MVPYLPEQFLDVKLGQAESDAAIRRYKRQIHAEHLTTDQMAEALRLGRERKHGEKKTAEYFRKVNQIRWNK